VRLFLAWSSIEVLQCDLDQNEVDELLTHVDDWGFDQLCIESPRIRQKMLWRRLLPLATVAVTDPASSTLSMPVDVIMTNWRKFEPDELQFVRTIDMSSLKIDYSKPPPWGVRWNSRDRDSGGEGLSGAMYLEWLKLPAEMVSVPCFFCNGCPRLSHVETSACKWLVSTDYAAFAGCRSLRDFRFPSTFLRLDYSFAGTSIVAIDFTGTRVERVRISEMMWLERLVVPRWCVLSIEAGVPRLRTVIFGAYGSLYGWSPRILRFESLQSANPEPFLSLISGTRPAYAFAEVACVLGRDSFPFPP
jgi:hypothetical protein